MKILFFLFFLKVIIKVYSQEHAFASELISFNYVDFKFEKESDRVAWINSRGYENCIIAGPKIDRSGNIFVAIPRLKKNIPATFGKIETGNDGHSYIVPFPNWEMNILNENIDHLQSVLGFEIDKNNIV